MPDTEKIYNLNFLSTYTKIDVNEGIAQNKNSRRDYYRALSQFESETKEIIDTILDKRNKRELLQDLAALQRVLFKIGDTSIMPKVEVLIMMAKRNTPFSSISEKMYEVRNSVRHLVERINEADVSSGLDDDPVPAREPEPAADSKPASEIPGAEPMKPVDHAPFQQLMSMMEDFDFQGAERAARVLLAMRLEPYMEWFLKKIVECFDNTDYKGAREAVKDLLAAIAKREDDLRREAELKEKIEAAKTAKSEARKRAREEFESRMRNRPKILAIDDMPDVLTAIKEMLKDKYSVYCVTNHLAALKFASTGNPDLILLDIEMPQMNGFELLRLLRQMETCKSTPVIFLTGNVSVENIKTSVESGGNDFIKKPVDVKLLIEKIEKHLH